MNKCRDWAAAVHAPPPTLGPSQAAPTMAMLMKCKCTSNDSEVYQSLLPGHEHVASWYMRACRPSRTGKRCPKICEGMLSLLNACVGMSYLLCMLVYRNWRVCVGTGLPEYPCFLCHCMCPLFDVSLSCVNFVTLPRCPHVFIENVHYSALAVCLCASEASLSMAGLGM